MRFPLLLTIMTIVIFSLVNESKPTASATHASGSLAVSLPALALGGAGQATPRFSSVYTDLTKCGSGLTKKEEKEAEEQGTDIPTRCKAVGGYDVYISYSACTSEFTVEKGDDSIHLVSQAVGFKQKTVEWRLANGKPFAVIMRVYTYGGDDFCATGGKVTGESLLVKGLKGFEHIDAQVEVKGTPNPNVKAREIADKAYR